ncbi:hypothetical protein OAU50_08235 [Planctomycetota bacterium]|nr:hypothetical protein [Planctomycetota bacterium]
MNDQTFRRLALEGMRRKLDTAAQQQWDAHRENNPDAANFVDDLIASHRDVSTRFVESKRLAVQTRQADVDPAGDLKPTKLKTSDVVRLAWLFAVVSATISGLITLYALMGQDGAANAANQYTATTNEPSQNTTGNGTVDHTNSEPVNQPKNAPVSNTNEAENTPVDPLPVEPEPTPVLDGVFDVDLARGRASFRASGETDFTPMRDSAELFEGERVRVLEGSVRIQTESLSIRGSSKFDMTIQEATDSKLSLSTVGGRAAVRSARVVDLEVYGNRMTFKDAAFIIDVNATGSDLYLIEGFIDIRREDDFKKVNAPRHIVIGRGLTERALTSSELATLEPELLGPHRTLLNWDFENGRSVCNLGELAIGGARSSKHAMRSTVVAPDVGTDLSGALFVSAPKARLRFKVLTKASQIRISARLQMKDGWRRVSMRADVPAGSGWKVVTIPLAKFAFLGNRPGTGWQPYASYARLVFTSLSEAGSVFNAPEMLIDDVHIYTPE